MTNLFLTAQAQSPDLLMTVGSLLPLVLIMVVFYFMLIRPQKKRDKEVQKMRESVEVGDEIITAGGIVGRLVTIKDDTIVLETAESRSKIRVARWAIQQNNTAVARDLEQRAALQEEKKAKK